MLFDAQPFFSTHHLTSLFLDCIYKVISGGDLQCSDYFFDVLS